MEWYWWVLIIIIVGGLVVWRFFQSAVGAAMPIGPAGRLYLSNELKKLGIRHLIPDPVVVELADRSTVVAEMDVKTKVKSQMAAKTDMVRSLDMTTQAIYIWLKGSDDFIKKDKHFSDTMTQHGISYGRMKQTR